ncbi:MAG: hypothetical protein AB7S26_21795 [Sandaracinaceae bacterium]
MRIAAAIAIAVAFSWSAPASAQREGPQACGQDAQTADYGELREGSVVVPQRHRFVAGDPNWDPAMARHLGRVARVSRLSGVDEAGCPGVRLDVDGGRHFWRVRDLNVGQGVPSRPPRDRIRSSMPQQCGQTDLTATFGALRVGSTVVLGRHRPVRGDDNWSPEMGAFVGRAATIVELAGTDEVGCPGVHVDADGRQWFWRVRDLAPSDGDAAIAYRPGLESDHGRPTTAFVPDRPADDRIPQMCAMTDDNVTYGPVAVGTEVELGRHREVAGETNWVDEMGPYVGRRARVTELVGVDEQGCALVRVDVDGGEWFWRARDLRLP